MHVNIPLLSSDLVSIGADQLCIDHSNIDALKYSLHALRIQVLILIHFQKLEYHDKARISEVQKK